MVLNGRNRDRKVNIPIYRSQPHQENIFFFWFFTPGLSLSLRGFVCDARIFFVIFVCVCSKSATWQRWALSIWNGSWEEVVCAFYGWFVFVSRKISNGWICSNIVVFWAFELELEHGSRLTSFLITPTSCDCSKIHKFAEWYHCKYSENSQE